MIVMVKAGHLTAFTEKMIPRDFRVSFGARMRRQRKEMGLSRGSSPCLVPSKDLLGGDSPKEKQERNSGELLENSAPQTRQINYTVRTSMVDSTTAGNLVLVLTINKAHQVLRWWVLFCC